MWNVRELTAQLSGIHSRLLVQDAHVPLEEVRPRPTSEPLISAEDASGLLGIHPVTLLRWAREGRVPRRRLGRKVTFRASELDSWYRTEYIGSAVRAAQP